MRLACESLPVGSARRASYERKSALLIQKMNAELSKRESPFSIGSNAEIIPHGNVEIRETPKKRGPQKEFFFTNGPGSELVLIFREHGIPVSDKIEDTTKWMDGLGNGGCRQEIDEIIERVTAEVSLEEDKVRPLVHRAISEATFKNRMSKKSEKSSVFSKRAGKKPLTGRPINRSSLVSHILYHFLPLSGPAEDVWRKHAKWLGEIRHEYNGRFLVGIATKGPLDRASDPPIMPAQEVMDALDGLGAEFFPATNNPKMGEGMTFPLMLESIKTKNPDEVFFYGHTKGVTRWMHKRSDPPHLWAEAMFDTLFRNREEAISMLDAKAITGPFRMTGGRPIGRPGIGPWWFYSGTFFAARCSDVFRRNWQHLPFHYGCVEQWPRLNFDMLSESSCLFFDRTDNLYDEAYWSGKVTPEFEKWKKRKCQKSQSTSTSSIDLRQPEISQTKSQKSLMQNQSS